jgi:pullulanase
MKKIIIMALFAMSSLALCAQKAFVGDGGHYDAESGITQFAFIASPKAKKPVLRIYKEGQGGTPLRTVRLKQLPPLDFVWVAELKGDWRGFFYTLDISGNKKEWLETPGIGARAVGVNGKRGYVIDLSQTNPEGWDKDCRPEVKSPADLVIYEMHHRDFSVHPASGFTNKGKFLALTEQKAISHLKELGVNAIHILPSYDYGSVDETRLADNKYNWGYDPVNYNVPEGSYSTNPFDPATRIREFKQMVQALHKAGIRVILDVVYNHTYDIDHSNFQRSWPDYFYRKNADCTYSNGSGCGNETASEQPFMRQYMIESVKYWINEYHIDGFRFDLMGVHDIETMNLIRQAVDEIDPTIFIYGEGWSAGSCALPGEQLATKAHIPQMPRIAAFSDELRDALRGPFSDDTKGAFLAGLPGEEESVKFGIAGAISHPQVDMSKVNYSKEPWATEPTQMISYVSCHDDMCLTDRLRASIPGLTDEELIRLDLLAQTAVFTSQGVPFMLSGEEMLRNKKGVHNSFESPDSINRLDWQNLKRFPNVFKYYKDLIRLRRDHPAFRLGNAQAVREHLEFLPSPPCTVAFRLKNHAGGDKWNTIVVVLNGSRQPQTVTLPEASYESICEQGAFNLNGINHFTSNSVTVQPQSATILHDCP